MDKYKTIYADPPWNEVGGGKIRRGADRHYPLMKTHEIIAMKDFIDNISEKSCHLYLWVTNNFLPDGLEVVKAWGFRYVTKIDWHKEGKIGLGQFFRGKSESCLFAVKGKHLPYKVDPITGKRLQGVTSFIAPVLAHSEKPEFQRQQIEKVSHAPYIELFARKRVENWDAWGLEVPENTQLKLF